ncbi:MAG TPA: chloride channel protein [Caulobacteraceae bacterium]|nr:chloride channel protein [Caulobacteraceae bacterium]
MVNPANSATNQLADFKVDRRLIALTAMAVVVGVGGVAAAWVLLKLIALVTNLVWLGKVSVAPVVMGDVPRSPWMVAAPALGGLAIGLMARFGSEKIRGHGIPEAIEAILIGGSRMSPKVAVLKPLSSAISIGAGGPFGAEGPIIMTGGALGSLFAQFFNLSAAERKTLLVAGAAAGMTAVFGTPLAAIMLAVELLLFEWKPRSFIPVATAALIAIGLRPALFGPAPLFPFASDPQLPWWGLIACAGVGLGAGLLSSLLTKALYVIEDAFEKLPVHWMWWPMLGGLAVGLGGLVEPRALGVGYDVIGDLMSAHLVITAVLALFLVKAAIWLVSLSSGTSGGVLAPLLIMGGAMGWLIGIALPGPHGFWAILGMAAILGGTMRAPLTGAIFALELTGDVAMLPAVVAACATAYGVTVLLMKRSILTEKIARRGQHITREYAIDPFELTRVSEVMVQAVETLSADMTVSQAVAVLERGRHRIYPVVDDRGRPVGLMSRAEALRWSIEPGQNGERLFDRLSDAALPTAHPDDVAARAVDIMITNDMSRLPVTDRVSGRLVGLLTRKHLLQVRRLSAANEHEREVILMPARRGREDKSERRA